jgi:plastocyanin
MRNWFETLNAALEAEGLLDAWECTRAPISRGQTVSWTWEDGTRYGHYISVYRAEDGRYERPVHYQR